jgi:hypothetical protein
MTPLGDGKTGLALTLMSKEPREIVLAASLLFAGLAILALPASAQQVGYLPTNFTFGSKYSDVHQSTDYDRNAGNRDLLDLSHNDIGGHDSVATIGNKPGEGSSIQPSYEKSRVSKPADFNRDIFYKHKLEFSQDVGWLPVNIPFPFDFMMGATYNTYPLKYTLVPVISSLRWQIDSVKGPMILRGNWDVEFSGAVIAIPRGPETRYLAYLMGMRRNFVPRNWRATPYFDWRIGLGNIDAKGPLGVPYAQGQNFTFTLNMGSGVRYNLSPRYAITAGVNWMHISNANLSEGNGKPDWGIRNYGINVYGPIVGIDIQLRRHHGNSAH